MPDRESNQAEYLKSLEEKLWGYVKNEVRTGFKEYMYDDALHEYLHNYFADLFTREVQIEEVDDGQL